MQYLVGEPGLNRRRRTSAAVLCVAAPLALAICACDQDALRRAFSPRSKLPPVTDRLRNTYPDLASNRFLVLADFEKVEQGEMFTMETPDNQGSFHVTAARSRRETGAGSLAAEFRSPRDILIAGDDPRARWTLAPDWRTYSLLLMSVHADQPANGLTIEIVGNDAARSFRRERIPLSGGWNLLRFDLEEIGRFVDLSSVRQVRWHCEGLAGPRTLHLDDVLLADNRKVLLGDPAGPEGDLYAVHEGLRLRVGAVGRFEWAFSGGRLVGWTEGSRSAHTRSGDPALADSAAPRRNWVSMPSPHTLSLGPVAVAMRPNDTRDLDLDGQAGWVTRVGREGDALAAASAVVQTAQRLLECSPLRVVVECERMIGAADGTDADSPRSVTRYVVTPEGRCYVYLQCRTEARTWRAAEIGLALMVSRAAGFGVLAHPASLSTSTDSVGQGAFLLLHRAGASPAASDLLCVPHAPQALPDVTEIVNEDESRIGGLFLARSPARPQAAYALMLAAWPPDIDDREAGSALADSYLRPAALRFEVGELLRTDPGDLTNDGFNESEGCYVLQPQKGRLRFLLDGTQRPLWHPMFKVADSKGRRIWAYAEGRILDTPHRTHDDLAIFKLDRMISSSMTIEVILQDPAAPTPEPTPAVGSTAEER